MNTGDIKDELFLQAVEAVDTGNIAELKHLTEQNPRLITAPLPTPGEEGYFKDPYLLWFIADNPIRNNKLAHNIVEITRLLVDKVKQLAPATAQVQLNYALGLVATGRTPRESGRQIALMDVLIDAGAKPCGGKGALANGNKEAAAHLIDRGGKLTLAVAVGLRRADDIDRLLPEAGEEEKTTALTLAAFYGMADIVAQLIEAGVNPNGYPPRGNGFHSHATPLHQAVSSGSLATVRILVDAGADLQAADKIYNGTPLGWAHYMQRHEETTEVMREKYQRIEDYLKTLQKL